MKKIVSLILCMILVLGMAVSAFAVNEQGTTGTIPNNGWAPNNPTGGANQTQEKPAPTTTIYIDMTDDEPEEDVNPDTGAPVFGIFEILAVSGAALIIGKRK